MMPHGETGLMVSAKKNDAPTGLMVKRPWVSSPACFLVKQKGKPFSSLRLRVSW